MRASGKVAVDLAPAVHMVRAAIAHVVCLAKTQCRPRVHTIPLDVVALEPLARALSGPGVRPL